jgi:tRNA threonylcarbamoyl adenosine modification protein YeaZ
MKTLIIDTSSAYCLLALIEDDRLLSHTLYLHENRLSHSLLPEISTLASPLKSIDRIAVGVGPGSYTGTRVGVTVAKTLAYALNIPLRGFCSLAAFIPNAFGTFASVLAAKSGLFYILTGEKHPHSLTLAHAELIDAAALHALLPTVDFVTSGNPLEVKNFLPSHPDPHNILHLLQSPPAFPFETDPHLIYLHAPT